MTEPIELRLLSESRLETTIHGGLLTYNPTIELFAGARGREALQIWRSNGQTVAKTSQRGGHEAVQALHWKPGGQFLAVGWSDGIVRLMGLETSKTVHQMTIDHAKKSTITSINWAQNLAGKRPPTATKSSASDTWRELANQGLDVNKGASDADLPRELTFLEIETALPKISPLPASGGSGDDMFVFTTRASLEFLFKPFSRDNSDKVDVMIVGTNESRIHISIYDSFVIGNFTYRLPASYGNSGELQLQSSTSNIDLSTHMLLMRPATEARTKTLFLVPIDLIFIHSSPENLSLLASKTTTLQKLLRYVKQTQVHMLHEWQSTRELPARFLKSINETLAEAGPYEDLNIGQALYHSVVTGHTFPEVKEWLIDQLAERGHKRWDKAVVSGLTGLRNLIHQNFLPALERIAIILSRLLGIARFHEAKAEIGFSSAQILKIMDVVSCLTMVGHKILLLVMEELDLFHAFSVWLRHEIDRLASSSVSEELTEKEATMDHGKVLTYIQQYMQASPLQKYLCSVTTEVAERDQKIAEGGSALLELLKKQVKKQESGQPETSSFSQVEFLCNFLGDRTTAVLDGISEAERRSVRFGHPTKIEMDHNISQADIRMSASQTTGNWQAVTHTVLTTEESQNKIFLFRTVTTITNGISGTVATESSSLVLGDGTILDAKFLDDDNLLALWRMKDSTLRLILLPHNSEKLGYQLYTSEGSIPTHELTNEQVTTLFVNMVVPDGAGFTPALMEIKEATTERGELPARVCLLGNDMQTYKIFALPEKHLAGASKHKSEVFTA